MNKEKVEIILHSWSRDFDALQTLECLFIAGHSSTPTEINEFFAKEDVAMTKFFAAYAEADEYR